MLNTIELGCIIGSQYVDVPILRDPLLTMIRANTINTAIAGAVLMVSHANAGKLIFLLTKPRDLPLVHSIWHLQGRPKLFLARTEVKPRL